MSLTDRILGPKIPPEDLEAHPGRYRVPAVLFGLASVVLVVSIFFPYWHLNLEAPQFPDGLVVQAYVNRLTGDTDELEGLNHYIGMASFESGAVFERTIAVFAIAAMSGLILAGMFIRSRWVLVFTLPALLFPVVFAVDLQYWLWRYGHELDPTAAFSASIKGFTPRVFGPGKIAQFETMARPDVGLLMALVASGLIAVGLVLHRKAYKPLVEALEADQETAGVGQATVGAGEEAAGTTPGGPTGDRVEDPAGAAT